MKYTIGHKQLAVPQIDRDIGITCYTTKFAGSGGKIRRDPTDFVVDEIIDDRYKNEIDASSSMTENTVDSTDSLDTLYPVYSLNKTLIDTNHALSDIYKRCGLRLYSLGLKDARAVTTQYVYSKTKRTHTKNIKTSRYALRLLGYTKKPLSKKCMIGNRFKIRITEAVGNDLTQLRVGISEFNEYKKILNFYGYQRFGSSRPVTHLIGKALVQKQYLQAIDYILSYVSPHDSDHVDTNYIRKELADPSKYAQVYPDMPPHMDLEKIVVRELIKHGDPLRAIRALPVHMRRFYVQAFQSYLFNLTLDSAFSYGEDVFAAQSGDVCYDTSGILGKYEQGLGGSDDDDCAQSLAIPIVGYSYYKKTRFDFYVSKILAEQEVTPRDFFLKEIQEASGEGGFRNAVMAVHDFKVLDSDNNNNTVSFRLSRGSFATMLMREIIKPTNPFLAGF